MGDNADHPVASLKLAVVQMDGVPNTLTWTGRHWIPSEPLVAGTTPPHDLDAMAASVIFSEATGRPAEILRKLERYSSDAARQKITEILHAANEEQLDVVVLPELLVPPSCVSVLLGYSTDKVIVAGIGLIRNATTAAELARVVGYSGPSPDWEGKNLAVMVHDGRVEVIEKKNAAAAEVLRAGSGPRTFTVRLRGRGVRLAVAICMDYLHEITALLADEPEIVCIPAYSSAAAPFMPDAPRDHVQLFANAAVFGGTTIVASGLDGPVFSQVGTVKPVPAKSEALVAVEYYATLRKPTPIHTRSNRLVLRAQLVPREISEDAPSEALRALAELRQTSSASSEQLRADIMRWLSHLNEGTPLEDSLRELRRLLIQETVDSEMARLLSAHFFVSPGNAAADVRARQAGFVVQRIGDFVSMGHQIDNAGLRLDRYGAVSRPTRAGRPDGAERPGCWTFAIRLGRYDADTAADSLPRQLNLLRAISTLPPGSVLVTYRIQAKPSAVREDSRAFFDVIVSGDPAEASKEEVEAQFRATMVSSWAISGSEEEEIPDGAKQFINITLAPEAVLSAIREDWSSVIDLLRTHRGQVAIDLRVVRAAEERSIPLAPPPAPDREDTFMRLVSAMPYVALVGDRSERVANAFHAMLHEGKDREPANLEFSIMLSSEDRLPALLVATIAHELLGPVAFSVERSAVYEHQVGGPTFRPSEVLRIFHPPFGRVQGRGTPEPEPYRRYFRGRRTPASGTKLGTARVSSPQGADKDLDIRIDELSRTRHIYVVGKTGTGKTNLLKEIARQDLEESKGLCVIDPHGDLVDYLTEIDAANTDDTVLLDFGSHDLIPCFNPLLVDCETASDRALHTTDLIQVLTSRFYNQNTGPRFNDLVLLAVETMFSPAFPTQPSITLIEDLYQNRETRGALIEHLRGTRLGERWKSFELIRESEKAELMSWALSKFASLMPEGSLLRLQLSAGATPLSISRIVEDDKTLLIKIPEAQLGKDGSAFLASLILKRIQRAVFAKRYKLDPTVEPKQTTILVDEFQKVADAGLESFVAEARKFNCALVMAHQNLEQLFAFSTYEGARSRELLEAILGNVGTVVSFRVGPQDRDSVARLLGTKESTVAELNGYQALCRMMIDGEETPPFTLEVDDSNRRRGVPANGTALRDRMVREGLWTTREQAEQAERQLRETFAVSLSEDRTAYAERQRQAFQRVADDPELLMSVAEEHGDFDEVNIRLLRALTSHHLECREDVAQHLTHKLLDTLEVLEESEDLDAVLDQVIDEYGMALPEHRLARWRTAIKLLTVGFLEMGQALTADWMVMQTLQAAKGEVIPGDEQARILYWLKNGRQGPPPAVFEDREFSEFFWRLCMELQELVPDLSGALETLDAKPDRTSADGKGERA